MKRTSRLTLAVSTLALGVTLGLQPLSISLTAKMIATSGADARDGGGGNGGGGGGGGGNGGAGGDHGGGGGAGGDHGGGGGGGASGRGGSEARGGGQDKGDLDGSVAERGNKDGARSTSARGNSGTGSHRGNGEAKGLLEGFLTDVRSATGLGRSGKDAPKTTATKSTKSRDGKTTVTTTTTTTVPTQPVPSTEKISIGRLNAAHAVANGNTNKNLNSAVGQIALYAEALQAYLDAKNSTDARAEQKAETAMQDAAAALDRVANKPLSEESIAALNDILDIEGVAAADVMKAVETARKSETDETSTTPAESVEE